MTVHPMRATSWSAHRRNYADRRARGDRSRWASSTRRRRHPPEDRRRAAHGHAAFCHPPAGWGSGGSPTLRHDRPALTRGPSTWGGSRPGAPPGPTPTKRDRWGGLARLTRRRHCFGAACRRAGRHRPGHHAALEPPGSPRGAGREGGGGTPGGRLCASCPATSSRRGATWRSPGCAAGISTGAPSGGGGSRTVTYPIF